VLKNLITVAFPMAQHVLHRLENCYHGYVVYRIVYHVKFDILF